jgi:hypothetical protein
MTKAAKWFTDSEKRERALKRAGDDIGAKLERQRRALDTEYLKESVALLRRFATGYETKNGFDLRAVHKLSGAKLAKVRKFAPLIRAEQASDHVEAVARTPAQAKALANHTGQQWLKGRTRFIVHTPHPKTTTVKILPGKTKKTKGGKKVKGPPVVEVKETVKGGSIADRYFHIADYRKKPPVTFKQIMATTRKMLKNMPDGFYVLVTSTHGNIAAPIMRDRLLSVMERRYVDYDKLKLFTRDGYNKDSRGLAETVTGFKLVSFTLEGAQREYRTRRTRRGVLRAERAKRRAAKQRRIIKRLR